jgi:hypothetical protein
VGEVADLGRSAGGGPPRRGVIALLCCCALWALLAGCRDAAPPSPPAPSPPVAVSAPSPLPAEGLPGPMRRGGAFRRGVSLGLFVSERDPAARRFYYEQLLDEIRALGATDVSLVVRWSQRDVSATEIAPEADATDDDAVLALVIELARARGLRVFLLPILHLEERRQGQWRGTLRPESWERWWASYENFILHYARLSQEHRVALLSVGSELVSTESQQARWRALIAKVREVYQGELTYSANWDHFEPVQFWDALDVVGVTAYQELSAAPDPGEEALVEGWRSFRFRLRRWAAEHRRRYLFTEVGFPSHTEGAARPWDYTPRGSADPGLQLRAWRATWRVWHDDPALEGFFVWNWFGVGGAEDRGYTPRGKPTEALLRAWFEGSREPLPRPGLPPGPPPP